MFGLTTISPLNGLQASQSAYLQAKSIVSLSSFGLTNTGVSGIQHTEEEFLGTTLSRNQRPFKRLISFSDSDNSLERSFVHSSKQNFDCSASTGYSSTGYCSSLG